VPADLIPKKNETFFAASFYYFSYPIFSY